MTAHYGKRIKLNEFFSTLKVGDKITVAKSHEAHWLRIQPECGVEFSIVELFPPSLIYVIPTNPVEAVMYRLDKKDPICANVDWFFEEK